jgi:hypothetical protein
MRRRANCLPRKDFTGGTRTKTPSGHTASRRGPITHAHDGRRSICSHRRSRRHGWLLERADSLTSAQRRSSRRRSPWQGSRIFPLSSSSKREPRSSGSRLGPSGLQLLRRRALPINPYVYTSVYTWIKSLFFIANLTVDFCERGGVFGCVLRKRLGVRIPPGAP